MIRQEIKELIKKATGVPLEDIKIEHSESQSHGDYSTNIALKLQKPAVEIAAELKSNLFEKVEVAGPGFINFFLSQGYLQKELKKVLKEKVGFGQLKIGQKKKVNLEYCSANPTGPLHLGHGRGAFWGDTLSNVFEKAGWQVTREYFINDYGKQILLLGKSIDARYKEILGEKLEMEDNFYKGEYIKDIADKIVKKDRNKYLKLSDEKRIKFFTEFGLKGMLGGIKELLKKAGVEYDVWFSEKTLYKNGQVSKAIGTLKKKGLAYEKEGALWFASSKFGDDKDRVLVKADGEPTYFASDIAYHIEKASRKYDLIINSWGSDHWGYKPRLMAAAKVFGFDQKLKIVVGQFVRLVEKGQEVKMSKRSGTFFSLSDLIDEVGIDVTKFFFLTKSVDTHMDFNLDLAREQSAKNPVFYIQYAHARISSILRKTKIKPRLYPGLLKHSSELNLIKQLLVLPEIVEDTSRDYQVQRLPQYALELATSFHKFYRDCRVISDDKKLTQARLSLVLATQIVLKNVLDLMGISAPDKM